MGILLDLNDENDYYSIMINKQPPVRASMPDLKRVSSEVLLGARKELVIVHNGRDYRLRLTQNGKLILTA
jgi:hemin uptake protein HemP